MIAQKKDLPALTALWALCFGDRPEDIRAFWQGFPDGVTAFCHAEKGQPVAMLCALPAEWTDDCGEARRAAYLYAVCTHPSYRGRGLCAALTAEAEQALRQQGVSVAALVPAGESLFRFYERLGYRTVFFHDTYTVDAAQNTARITPIDAAAYRNLREMQLYSDFLSYDERFLRRQAVISEGSGAGLYRVETEHAVCCAAAEKRGKLLLLKELLPDVPEAAAALAHHCGCTQTEIRTVGTRTPFGMAKSLDGTPLSSSAYLGLALD